MQWLIVTETYREMSNGVKIMHKMCDMLNAIGEKAYMAFITSHPNISERQIFIVDNKNFLNLNLNTPILPENKINENFYKDTIVILPECYLGDTTKYKKVVKFLGNKPGNCTPGFKCELKKSDFLLSHSKNFVDNPNAVLFNSHIDSMFYDDKQILFKDRKLDLIYHGKGVLTAKCETYENTFYIDRCWPQDRKQLAYLLKQCRYFYTYDAMTNINAEAVAAGAVPIFLRWEPWTEQEVDDMELGAIPRGQLLEIKDNNIYATVDLEKFIEQRKIFLNNVKYYEETWDNRFKEVVEKIKQYFN